MSVSLKYGMNWSRICLLLGVALWLWGCSQNKAPINPQEVNNTEATMNSSELAIASSTLTIPPIDAAAPDVFETATFGLG